MGRQQERAVVDGTPVLVATPEAGRAQGRLAVWVPFLGGTKEIYAPVLDQLSDAGFVAVGIDPRRHGERADLPMSELFPLVMGAFRKTMWPLLGGTVLDVLTVIDWAIDHYDLDDDGVVAGGVSMGGDIAVALAGIDPRIRRVAAVAGTPDWTRPGMTIVDDPTRIIDQGQPGSIGRWFYEQFDPITHTSAYDGGLTIRFDVGGADTHVPGEAAHRFADVLTGTAASVEVIDHPGMDHMATAQDQQITNAAVCWVGGD